ncbi:hypothetical protein [Pectobacterium brasiliense]|uniref:hypothetical protein n=1 Tax=Pectobacterium brasiliense TaxID=180957 RepID=UPI0025A224A9|nr:hypothetical protein [Pectobacterium brasiliense]WJM80795.1 hypothetical protein QTI90_21510 [Pectobacterium brasiliense]
MKKTEPVSYGSDVSAGTYICADCGYEYSNQSKKSLPPCPNSLKKDQQGTHTINGWLIQTGQGDAKEDPYPEEK